MGGLGSPERRKRRFDEKKRREEEAKKQEEAEEKILKPVDCQCGASAGVTEVGVPGAGVSRVKCSKIACWLGPRHKTAGGAIVAWNETMEDIRVSQTLVDEFRAEKLKLAVMMDELQESEQV